MVVFCTACEHEVEKPTLTKPKFHKTGPQTLSWKKVLHPRLSMAPVGYVKVNEYRFDKWTAVPFFEVLNKHYEVMGHISDTGAVSRFVFDDTVCVQVHA